MVTSVPVVVLARLEPFYHYLTPDKQEGWSAIPVDLRWGSFVGWGWSKADALADLKRSIESERDVVVTCQSDVS